MSTRNEFSKSLNEHQLVEGEKRHAPLDHVQGTNTSVDQDGSSKDTGSSETFEDLETHPTKNQKRPETLFPTRSVVSTHSQRSYAAPDGYTCFSEDEGTQPVDNIELGSNQDKEIIVTWDGEDDPKSPRSIGLARKWAIVIILSLSSLCVTCASAMYTSTYSQIEKEFGCSREVATLGLSLFVMGLGTGPLLLSPVRKCVKRM